MTRCMTAVIRIIPWPQYALYHGRGTHYTTAAIQCPNRRQDVCFTCFLFPLNFVKHRQLFKNKPNGLFVYSLLTSIPEHDGFLKHSTVSMHGTTKIKRIRFYFHYSEMIIQSKRNGVLKDLLLAHHYILLIITTLCYYKLTIILTRNMYYI